MAVTFYNVNSEAGLQKLNEYLLTRSYITGYQASKDDIVVHAAISSAPSSEYVNVCRWYSHIDALLKLSGVTGEGQGVTIEGSAPPAEEVPSSPAIDDKKAPAAEEDDDDDDVDLFGEETEEEKKAAEERAAAIKASGKKKESGKSSVLLDVKPWDDETDMQKVEEAVRSIKMEGLFWGASKLVPVGYGIKKLQIMMTIVDDLVSVDSLIEEHLTVEPANEYIQSCDIVAFNKICKYIMLRNQLPSSIPWCSRVILISLAPYFTIPYQSFIFDYLTSRKDKPILHNNLYAKGPMGRAVWSPTHGVRTGQKVSCSNPRCGG